MTTATLAAPCKETITKKARPSVRPKTDIYRDEKGYRLLVELPGVKSEDLELTSHLSTLSISASNTVEADPDMRLIHREFTSPDYNCSFNLPDEVDLSRIEASLKNGLLDIRLGLKEAAIPKKIEVKIS